MPKISVVVITRNEEKNIARCLESAASVSDELIVVDAESTDGTAAVAEKLGARVFSRRWDDYSSAKNFGNRQASHDQVLSLDADEVLSAELARSVGEVRGREAPGNYRCRRLSWFGGRWIRHGGWYPDIKIRLFDRRDLAWAGTVHETLANPHGKPVGWLQGDLLHYPFDSDDAFVRAQRRYAALAAEALHRQGFRPRFYHLYLKPAFRFLRDYVWRRGFLDGLPGYRISLTSAYAVYWKYAAAQRLFRGT
jgi:glycosyltransferase involved in cell wall biosynthesis